MPLRSRSLLASRAMLGLAALDSVASGTWAILHPDQVFGLLKVWEVPHDAFLLPVLGGLLVVQGLCLLAAAVRPEPWGGFVWVPLIGKLLLACVWLWLLGAEKVAVRPALLLIAHDLLWLPGFVVFLGMLRRLRPGEGNQ